MSKIWQKCENSSFFQYLRPPYTKKAFSTRHPCTKNGIFDDIPYTKKAFSRPPYTKMGILDTLFYDFIFRFDPLIQKRPPHTKFDPKYIKCPKYWPSHTKITKIWSRIAKIWPPYQTIPKCVYQYKKLTPLYNKMASYRINGIFTTLIYNKLAFSRPQYTKNNILNPHIQKMTFIPLPFLCRIALNFETYSYIQPMII